MHVAVAGKLVNLRQLRTVIYKTLNPLAVFCGKVLTHHLERLTDTFTDSDARHHDDELAPAIELIQFKHRLDIGVGLTRTRFHLNGQSQVCPIKTLRRLQLCSHLDIANMVQHLAIWHLDGLVLIAHGIEEATVICSQVVRKLQQRSILLPLEHIRHSLCCIRLELLVLKFQLHESILINH